MLLALAALRPADPDTAGVVVAAADLPPGTTLTADDLTITDVPAAFIVPGTATRLDDAVGRTIATGIGAGEPLTESRFVTSRPRADGLHTVPVRLADPETAELLSPGTTIDLVLATGDAGGRVIAEGVQVVTIPRRASSGGLGTPPRSAGSLIVVAAERRTAVTLAAMGTQPGLGVVLH